MSWNEPIDFFARGEQAIDLLAPIYRAMDEFMRGEFFVPEKLLAYTQALGVEPVGLRGSVNRPLEVNPPARSTPMVTCNYRDLLVAVRLNSKRPQIHLQVSDFKGAAQDKVHLFLCRDEARQDWVKKNWMNKTCILVEAASTASGLPLSAQRDDRAAEAIVTYVKEHSTLRSIAQIDGESIGILYMAFGEKAAAAVRASLMSLRRIGLCIPVCVVGDTPVKGTQFIEWTGESPFDAHERRNFQFRAGRIKPKLYALSPFELTLYIDADTEFMEDILPGFEALGEYDAALARETITLAQLYNKKLAGWEINLIERDATVSEIGNANQYFLNSGVLFFRKSAAMEMVMRRWHEEWLRWRQWDEQLALMRAFYKTHEAKVKVMEPGWNYPHRHKGIVIFHNYGRGVVRMNVGLDTGREDPAPTRPAMVEVVV